MITWFVSSISRLFGGRRRQRPMDRAPVPPSVLNLHLPVGEEEIAPPRLEGPPDSNANLAPIDPHALAGAVASFILPRMAKLLSQQGNEISSSTKKALEDLNPVIGDNFTFHGKKVGDDVLRRLDKQCRLFQAMIERSVTPMGERIADSMRNEIASHLTTLRREVTESCSAATQRAALKPIVDQLIALYDRINDEREFLNSAYRREPDLTLHLGSRQLQERGDAAVRSFAAEVLIILRSIGVEPIVAGAGPIDLQIQRGVGVEPTSRTDLDGHIARIVRAGFTWNGTLLRSENVIVFKKGNQP